MKTYAINLTTVTKSTDIYERVSVNKFPIIVRCKTENELKDYLSTEDTKEYVKKLIRTQKLFDESEWFIRSIYPDGMVYEQTIPIKDLLSIEF